MIASPVGDGRIRAARQVLGSAPLSVASLLSVVPFMRTAALISSGCQVGLGLVIMLTNVRITNVI